MTLWMESKALKREEKFEEEIKQHSWCINIRPTNDLEHMTSDFREPSKAQIGILLGKGGGAQRNIPKIKVQNLPESFLLDEILISEPSMIDRISTKRFQITIRKRIWQKAELFFVTLQLLIRLLKKFIPYYQ